MSRIQVIYKDRIDESKQTIQQAIESAFRWNVDDCGYVVVLDGEWKENVQLYHGVNLYLHNGVTFKGTMRDGGRTLSAVISGNGIVSSFPNQNIFEITNPASYVVCNCNIASGSTSASTQTSLNIFSNDGKSIGTASSNSATNLFINSYNTITNSYDCFFNGRYNASINSKNTLFNGSYITSYSLNLNDGRHSSDSNIINGFGHGISSSRFNIISGWNHSISASHLNVVSGTSNILINICTSNNVLGRSNLLSSSYNSLVLGSQNTSNIGDSLVAGSSINATGSNVFAFGNNFTNTDSNVFIVQHGTAKPNLIVSSVGLTGSRIFALANPQSTLEVATKGYVDTVAASGATGVTSWGSIIGSITAQTDLQGQLDLKPNLATANTYTSGTQTFNQNQLTQGTAFFGNHPQAFGSALTAIPTSTKYIPKWFADTEYTLTGALITASSNLVSYTNTVSSNLNTHLRAYTDTVSGNIGTYINSGRFSLSSHNHALANLSEKSYNSLDNKPDLSVTAMWIYV